MSACADIVAKCTSQLRAVLFNVAVTTQSVARLLHLNTVAHSTGD